MPRPSSVFAPTPGFLESAPVGDRANGADFRVSKATNPGGFTGLSSPNPTSRSRPTNPLALAGALPHDRFSARHRTHSRTDARWVRGRNTWVPADRSIQRGQLRGSPPTIRATIAGDTFASGAPLAWLPPQTPGQRTPSEPHCFVGHWALTSNFKLRTSAPFPVRSF